MCGTQASERGEKIRDSQAITELRVEKGGSIRDSDLLAVSVVVVLVLIF